MSRIRSRGTGLERRMEEGLVSEGVVGFRTQAKDLPGTPDLAFDRHRLAVFFDSCFWHGCPQHVRMPGSNVEYWRRKIERNRTRDREVDARLAASGWAVLRFWEHDLRDPANVVQTIRVVLAQRSAEGFNAHPLASGAQPHPSNSGQPREEAGSNAEPEASNQ